jgi:preprotein translocase subunit YajC
MRKKMMTFSELKVGDKVKTNFSGMATVTKVGCNGGKMVKLKCDKPKWSCPYFYETELDFKQ